VSDLVDLLRARPPVLHERYGLLVLSALLFLGLCALLAIYGPQPLVNSADFVLLNESSCNKVNNTSADASLSPLAEALQKEVDLRSIPDLNDLEPAPLPVLNLEPSRRLTITDEPPLILAQAREIVWKQGYLDRSLYSGETPMIRTWRLIGLNTLAAVLVTAGPSLADPTTPPSESSKKLDEIQRQLDELSRNSRDTAKTLAAIEQDLRTERSQSVVRDASTQRQIDALREELGRLRAEVESLRNRPVPSATREASASPLSTSAEPAASLTGHVKMMNTYPSEIGIRVNRRLYRLAPNETRWSESIPAGAFTYEVVNVSPGPQTRTVAPGGEYTIWVHP
jgi:hypothetical protein